MIKNIIIDCDPGHDDAIAIIVALANPSKLNVLAVGTVGGNTELDKVTINAQRILQIAKAKVPLYKGASKPLEGILETQESAHGDSGMDGPVYTEPVNYKVEDEFAVDAYKDIIENNQDVTLVGLGPLTNIALLITTYPHLKPKIKEISIMGGATERGNITAAAEFNIYADPKAAKIVFESGIPIVMSGLDVTEKAYLTIKEIETFNNKDSLNTFIYQLLKFYNNSGKQFGFEDSAIHDASAIIYLLEPEIYQFNKWPVTIVTSGITRGMTLADKRLRPAEGSKIKVLTNIDRNKFKNIIFNAIKYFREEV